MSENNNNKSFLTKLLGLIATFTIIISFIIYFIYDRYFSLQLIEVEILSNIQEDKGNCPRENFKIWANITTNKKTGRVYYKFKDAQSGKSFSKDYKHKDIFDSTDTTFETYQEVIDTNFLNENISNIDVVFEYYTKREDYIGKVIDYLEAILKMNKEKRASADFSYSCIQEKDGMKYIDGDYLKLRSNVGIVDTFVKGFFIDIDEISIRAFYDYYYKTYSEDEGNNFILPEIENAYIRPEIFAERNIDYQDNYPMTKISWDKAQCYCQFLEKRLPTEFELSLIKQKNRLIESCKESPPLNSFFELDYNDLGLRGVNCNALEWCFNTKKEDSDFKSVKGGGSFNEGFAAYYHRDSTHDAIGFRCVISEYDKELKKQIKLY